MAIECLYYHADVSLWTKILKRIDAAFIFSCLYTFYGYRTIDIYHRSAIAEAIALTVIPIVMYYAYALIYEKSHVQFH